MAYRDSEITQENLGRKTALWMDALSGSPGLERPLLKGPSALVVVDAQRIFCSPASPAYLSAWAAIDAQVHRTIQRFQANRLPVVFTRHGHPRETEGCLECHFFGRALRAEDPLAELLPEFGEYMDEAVIWSKPYHAAFACGLPSVLCGVKQVVLLGVQTPLCVLATAMDLRRTNIAPVLLADGCAAKREADHLAALRVAACGHAHVRTCSQIWDWLENQEERES